MIMVHCAEAARLAAVANALRDAGLTEATYGRLPPRVKTSGFTVDGNACLPGTIAMVCEVHPREMTCRIPSLALRSETLARYASVLTKAGWKVFIKAGCVWVEANRT
jgi:hypothetical protein